MEYLEYIQYFDEEDIPDVFPLDSGGNSSNNKVTESIAKVGGKSNKDSSHPVHV